jgi:hypothetical protein
MEDVNDKDLPNFGTQFLKDCLNYDSNGLVWTEEPKQFETLACPHCYSTYNKFMVVNNGNAREKDDEKYTKIMAKLFADQLAFSGVRRTLGEDYQKNIAFAGPGNYYNPNMSTYNSANGYYKICATWAMKIARAKDVKDLGKRITEWDRCGIYDIWTTTLNTMPGTTKEYIKWPSRKFRDWLDYIDWWGLYGYPGFQYVLIDDTKDSSLTNEACYAGKGGMMTNPWVGLVAVATAIASFY